jgi:hypothetical protein
MINAKKIPPVRRSFPCALPPAGGSELNHVRCRQRGFVSHHWRVHQIPRDVLLNVAIIRRHGIDWHDNFKSALYGAGGRVENCAVRGSADRNERLDSLGLEDFV